MKAITSVLRFWGAPHKDKTKSVFVKVAAGGFIFFLVKGIIWLVIMAAIAFGLLDK